MAGRARAIGTMVAYGFPEIRLASDLALAHALGATVLEIFPDWKRWPDPSALRREVGDAGLTVHSAHGCWGGQTIRAQRVDLSDHDPSRRSASVEDVRRCVDWLDAAGGTCLVVHPGGVSTPAQAASRRATLAVSLTELADHARGSGVVLCVENMPPGVHPGSRMADLAALLDELDRPELALAIDTGHAHLSATVDGETLRAGRLLRTTHVHDNLADLDTHWPPGLGSIDWPAWAESLDAIGYQGPIMLECVRHLRQHPDTITDEFRKRLRRLAAFP